MMTFLEQTNPRIKGTGATGEKPRNLSLWVKMSGFQRQDVNSTTLHIYMFAEIEDCIYLFIYFL